MVVHHHGKSRRLLFNLGATGPRIQLTNRQKENPLKAPMLCMLLRKYFVGARIVAVEQPNFDRIAVFTVSCYDEMGFETEKKIIVEIMGKYANLVVTDKDYKILTALKFVDFSASQIRQILPGLEYRFPAMSERLNPIDFDRDSFVKAYSLASPDVKAEKFITSTLSGVATQIARELVYRATGLVGVTLREVDIDKLYAVILDWQRLLTEHSYTPTLAVNEVGEPIDYSYMDITYFGEDVAVRKFDTLAELFDEYFSERDRISGINQKGKDLFTLLSNARSRTERKLALQRESLSDSERAEEYKKKADLITANLYRLKKGDLSFKAIDYEDENMPEIEVELDPLYTPVIYAQRLYKQYNKRKKAKEILTEQIALWENELKYLESVYSFLESASSEDDLQEIREELSNAGYKGALKGGRSQKKNKPRHLTLKTTGGYTLLVGRNNVQNDYITHRLATKEDIWFHVKDIPGSHVVMLSGGEEPSEQDYTEAASVAAYYSKASADLVAVDYTRVRNIKKPQGAKPGFVIYKTNYTAYVKPALPKGTDNNG